MKIAAAILAGLCSGCLTDVVSYRGTAQDCLTGETMVASPGAVVLKLTAQLSTVAELTVGASMPQEGAIEETTDGLTRVTDEEYQLQFTGRAPTPSLDGKLVRIGEAEAAAEGESAEESRVTCTVTLLRDDADEG